MIALAMDTGIAPAAWWQEDDRTIATALELKRDAAKSEGGGRSG